jgi:hypothetical protein
MHAGIRQVASVRQITDRSSSRCSCSLQLHTCNCSTLGVVDMRYILLFCAEPLAEDLQHFRLGFTRKQSLQAIPSASAQHYTVASEYHCSLLALGFNLPPNLESTCNDAVRSRPSGPSLRAYYRILQLPSARHCKARYKGHEALGASTAQRCYRPISSARRQATDAGSGSGSGLRPRHCAPCICRRRDRSGACSR